MQPADFQRNKIFEFCAMTLHIGQEIEKKFLESGLKSGEFAKKINTGARNLYSIFKRDHINAELLHRISKVLDFNFFSFYTQDLPFVEEPGVEYKRLKSEVELLKEQLDLTERLVETKDKLIKEYRKQSKVGSSKDASSA